jgi:hypothetical protein
MGSSFSKSERFLIGAIVVMGVWHFWNPRASSRPQHTPVAQNSAAPSELTETQKPFSNEVASNAILAKDPPAGTVMKSWEGDSCTLTSITHDPHPKGYKPGFTVKETKLYCAGKSGHYALNNIGVYKYGKLVSSRRNKIRDGHCHLLSVKKAPVPGPKKAEFLTAIYSCRKNGEEVWQEISNLYESKKVVLTQVSIRKPGRKPASVSPAAAVMSPAGVKK